MSRTLKIDPVTRVEEHLAIETRIEGRNVVEAQVSGRMYRGFEELLIGRHPVDAARITQRICGICHEVHGIAASLALEDLYGMQPTDNGRILRELILGLHLVTDHVFHFYQLTLPDYLDFTRLSEYKGKDPRVRQLDALYSSSRGTFVNPGMSDSLPDLGLTTDMAIGYADAIAIRKVASGGLASLGGKVPFCHAIMPGGVTTVLTSDRLMLYADALEKTRDFVERFYLPHALALAKYFPTYFTMGRSHGNFYSNGGFRLLDKPMYVEGILRADGTREAYASTKIAEVTHSSFYSPAGELDPGKAGAYSWVKALHYDGEPMEVGPLARLAVNGYAPFTRKLKEFGVDGVSSSVMARILARAYEAQQLCRYLFEVMPKYRLEEPTIHAPDMLADVHGRGYGHSLAARGALNHMITAEEGRVTSYKLHVPSAWNFGPTAEGKRGVVEEALVGTRVANPPKKKGAGEDAIEVGRIVRSFDPCLACAIH